MVAVYTQEPALHSCALGIGVHYKVTPHSAYSGGALGGEASPTDPGGEPFAAVLTSDTCQRRSHWYLRDCVGLNSVLPKFTSTRT